jgi:hypothetical protein
MQRLVAVDAYQPLVYRVNHQIHCLKGQGAEQNIVRIRHK